MTKVCGGTADAVSALGSRVSSASSCASIAALGGDQNSNHRPLMGPCDDQLDVLFRSGDRYCYPARVAMHGGVSKRLLSDSKETQCASPADVLYVTRSSTIGPWSHRKHHLSSARVELNTNAGFYLARARAKRASCGFNRGTGVTGSSPSQTCAARRTSTNLRWMLARSWRDTSGRHFPNRFGGTSDLASFAPSK